MKKMFMIVFILLPCITSAQSVVYLKTVAGSYNMKDMKVFQSEICNAYKHNGIPLKITLEFPASLQEEFGMDYQNEDMVIGFFVNYTMTKGRMHYGDYSGETYAEQNLMRIATGFKASKTFRRNFGLYGKIALNYSQMDFNFATHLKDVTPMPEDDSDDSFRSLGIVIEPGVQWRHTYHRLVFLANLGYELNFNGKIMSDEVDNAYLMHDDESPVIINWSGMRLGLGVGISLYKDRPMH